MKVLLINVVCGIRSTGRICTDLAEALESEDNEVQIAYGRENVPEKYAHFALRTESDNGIKFSALQARFLDNAGFANRASTTRLIERIQAFDPDIIHLHVIHGYWINIPLLFDYLRGCGKKIIWTFHDCWAFTGHCAYFDYTGCEKWKTGCFGCPDRKEYPSSILLDRSEVNFREKKKMFTGIPNLLIVTPSEWLAEYVKKSFLKEYPVKVIHNGIDTSVFQRTQETLSIAETMREKYGLSEKKVVTAVSTSWNRRKGLSEYLKLADQLGNDYQVVIIGLNKEQIAELPGNVLGIEKTDSTIELAGFYVLSQAYVNASLEENYPTTNLEAIACGTPVITYDVGGSGESAALYGEIVPRGDIEALAAAVKNTDRLTPRYSYEECRKILSIDFMTRQYRSVY